jgi:hypothetical protein
LERLRVFSMEVQVFIHEKCLLLAAKGKISYVGCLFGGFLWRVLNIAEVKFFPCCLKLTIHMLILTELVSKVQNLTKLPLHFLFTLHSSNRFSIDKHADFFRIDDALSDDDVGGVVVTNGSVL